MDSTYYHSTSSSSEDDGADLAMDAFMQNYGSSNNTPQTASATRLGKPVVIPQRRPGNKERGFVKAYAPDLKAFGIDQETFMAFIHAVNKNAKASKWLHAIQVAAFGTGFIPNHIAFGVSAATQIVAGIVAKTETRWKTNAFMDQMNADFFQPRGLYCLIMSYNPVNTPGQVNSDPVQAMVTHKPSSSAPAKGLVSKAKQNLRSPSAGTSQGEENLPDCVADLVYPETASAPNKTNSNTQKKPFARLDHYFDRRAQARYASESKNDVLSSNQHGSFSNRYLDPNHPATNGGLLGLLSGGKLTPDLNKQKEQMRSAIADQQQAVLQLQSDQRNHLEAALKGMGLSSEQQQVYVQQLQSTNDMQMQQFEEQSKMLENGMRRINRNILYLMVINLPTAEEIEVVSEKKRASSNGLDFNGVHITSLDV